MITLQKISQKNVWKVVKLSVDDAQKDFVATNTESILEAFAADSDGDVALPFAIYDGDIPVGFLMVGYSTLDGEDAPAVAKNNYSIWRLMIDKNCQGKGYSRAAMTAVLDYIRTWPCGRAQYCWLSYEPSNVVAKALYNSFGFIENGEKDGDDIVAVLKL